MRGAWGLIGLLMALAIVGLVAKQRLSTISGTTATSAASGVPVGVSAPQVNTPEQAQQLQKQVQDDVNQMMQNRASEIDKNLEPKP